MTTLLPFTPRQEEITGFRDDEVYIGFARQVTPGKGGPWMVYPSSNAKKGHGRSPRPEVVQVASRPKAVLRLAIWGATEIEDSLGSEEIGQDSKTE